MNYTWADLFQIAWPKVPLSDASIKDAKLFADHAESLNTYNQSKGE